MGGKFPSYQVLPGTCRINWKKHWESGQTKGKTLLKDRLIRGSDQPKRGRRVGKGRVVAHCEPRCGQIESNEWALIPTCLTAVYWKHCPDCTRMQVLHIIIAVSSAQSCILPHLICNAINTYQNNNQITNHPRPTDFPTVHQALEDWANHLNLLMYRVWAVEGPTKALQPLWLMLRLFLAGWHKWCPLSLQSHTGLT